MPLSGQSIGCISSYFDIGALGLIILIGGCLLGPWASCDSGIKGRWDIGQVGIDNFIGLMKVELGKDPLFEKRESPVKEIKERELERQKQMRIMRMNPITEKQELQFDIVDPLPEQLKTYKSDIDYKKTTSPSKASYNLKKYIIEQERNLKCLRLERMEEGRLEDSRAKKGEFKFQLPKQHSRTNHNKSKEISIPEIEEVFKDQQRDYMLYESREMKNKLARAIQSIDFRVNNLHSSSMPSKTMPVTDSRRTQHDRFPVITHPAHKVSESAVFNEEDVEIDKLIEKKLKQSLRLREKLYKQKRQMSNHQGRPGQSSQSKNLSFFLSKPVKPRKKVILKGVKPIPFQDGDRQLNITPASHLLFELSRMMSGKDQKERELSGLLHNSFQNREAILFEKSSFYETQTPFNDLSPSNQFKLRQLMDKKLFHRLELSKEQVNKFIAYVAEIKESYHYIINDTILQILKEVRQILTSGKVMKTSDLQAILKTKNSEDLKGEPNKLIVDKLFEMMI